MADVIEINDLAQLEPYRMTWNALLLQTPRASFFHTFDWFQTYWKHFGEGQKMRVLVVRAAGKPIGIVPLCVQTEQYRVGKVRVLNYPLSDWGSWYGPLGPDAAATMFMAMKHLQQTERDWDLMELRWNDAQQSNRAGTARAMQAAGFQPQRSAHQQLSRIQFEGDWNRFLASKNSKWRHNLQRQERAIEKCGKVGFIRFRPAGAAQGDGDPRWDLFETCQELSARSWQGQSTTGTTLCHPQVRNFLRDAHEAAARLGMVDLAVLTFNGQPAAFGYNYHYHGHLFGLRMGYDRQICTKGLGNVLITRMMRDSFARGDHSFDLGLGELDYKKHFRTEVQTSYRFSCFPRNAWRSQGVRFSRWLKSRNGELPAPKARLTKQPQANGLPVPSGNDV